MSKIAIAGATTGTGTFTLASPATNVDRVLTLPDEAGTVLTSAGVPASAMPAGSVLQTVHFSSNTDVINNTGSYVSTGLTASITPLSASSKILVTANIPFIYGSNNYVIHALMLKRNGVEVARVRVGNSVNAYIVIHTVASLIHMDLPNTTSAITYDIGSAVEVGAGIYGDQVFSSGNNLGNIVLMEIAA